MVKGLLRKHKYPPDRSPVAIEEVLNQAELVASGWVFSCKVCLSTKHTFLGAVAKETAMIAPDKH